jgi:hypothetical protein
MFRRARQGGRSQFHDDGRPGRNAGMNSMSGPVGRLELTQAFRCRTMDAMSPHWQCPGCGGRVRDPNVYAVGSVLYDTVDQLAGASRQALSVFDKVEPPRCGRCGIGARLRAADYHAFHSERGYDLVLRWPADADAPERLWWDGEAYAAADLTQADCWCVTGDAFIRRAAVKLEVEGLPEAIEAIGAAVDEVPGDRELLAFVPVLIEGGYIAMAREILDEYTSFNPDDDDARELLEALASP